jgi:hypothetical protein
MLFIIRRHIAITTPLLRHCHYARRYSIFIFDAAIIADD